VDLLLIHWPNPAFDLAETLHAMEELQKKGRARHIGISNFPVTLMREAVETIGAPVFCNQVEYHPFLSQNAVLDYARRHDILVTAYSPLAQGENGIFRNKTLKAIAEAHGKSVAQVVLRWLVQQKNVAAIPRTAKESHAASNFDIFDFKLSAAEMKQISGLAANRRVIDPSWAPAWDAA
jgi:2,5-diketo-D-gluconate reductase B